MRFNKDLDYYFESFDEENEIRSFILIGRNGAVRHIEVNEEEEE